MVKEAAIIFDVDKTIITSASGKVFAKLAIKRGVLPIWTLILIPIYFIYYYFGRMGIAFFEKKFPVLEGKTREQLLAVSRECFAKYLKHHIYQEAVDIIKEAKAKSILVLLATSSIDIIVKPIADFLGVEYFATRMEFEGEISTGRFISPPLFGREKKNQVLAYLEKKQIDPCRCAFYTDSVNDLPLLEAVGHPVAVNPDMVLKKIAAQRGWEIKRFTAVYAMEEKK